MKKRPVGITILAFLCCIGVAFYFVLSVLTVVDRTALGTVLKRISGGGTGFYFGFMTLFTAALGRGFWQLKNWARLIALVLIGFSVIVGGIEIIHAWPQSTASGIATAFFRVAVSCLIFWYLCSPSVRAAFRPAA